MAFWIITINLSTLLFDIKDRRKKKKLSTLFWTSETNHLIIIVDIRFLVICRIMIIDRVLLVQRSLSKNIFFLMSSSTPTLVRFCWPVIRTLSLSLFRLHYISVICYLLYLYMIIQIEISSFRQ